MNGKADCQDGDSMGSKYVRRNQGEARAQDDRAKPGRKFGGFQGRTAPSSIDTRQSRWMLPVPHAAFRYSLSFCSSACSCALMSDRNFFAVPDRTWPAGIARKHEKVTSTLNLRTTRPRSA